MVKLGAFNRGSGQPLPRKSSHSSWQRLDQNGSMMDHSTLQARSTSGDTTQW